MFTCPHCGRKTLVFCEDQFETIEMGRETCEHCQQEFLIVNDVPMTEQEYQQRCPKHNKRLMLRQNAKTKEIALACPLCDVEAVVRPTRIRNLSRTR